MLWKSSEYLGVGVAYNNFNEVYVVCNYEPPGNILREFNDNIMDPALYHNFNTSNKFIRKYLSNDFKYLAIFRYFLINLFLLLLLFATQTTITIFSFTF